MARRLLKQDKEKIDQLTTKIESVRTTNSQLEERLTALVHDRDDALIKLQRTVEDYARHRDDHQATNRAWQNTEATLHNKINILENALEVAKNEISRSFVDGFQGAVEQIKLIQPDLDISCMGPFKSVVDGWIADEE